MNFARLAVLPPALAMLVLVALLGNVQLGGQSGDEGKEGLVPVGAASIEITPEKPIRLAGYGSRTTPSEGFDQRLRAQALAFGEGTDESPLSVLVTLDAIGIPAWVTEELAKTLESESGVHPSQVAVAATHTHAAPALVGMIPYMFPSGTTEEERTEIENYTSDILEKLRQVSREAIAARKPSRLSWGKGEVTFAANRRVLENGQWTGFGVQPDGPVDHTLPVMKVEDPDGSIVAVLANYACHCTTLGGKYNRIHGDWAGIAREEIEQRHPGATALIAIGCGADQNPEPRGELENAVAHGRALADEVDRLLESPLEPLTRAPVGTRREIELALDDPPARETWEKQVEDQSRGHHFARAMLEKLDRGEALPTTVDYPIQTWTFGDDLAMLFLAGEVVVDYALRFYEEFDADRLWINAYSNDVPCYIPTRRITGEGGYEVDYSMVYYGQPARLALDTEDRIADEVLRQMPHPFYSEETKKLLPPPVEKSQALDTIRVSEGYEVELVAAEPLVQDPVDIAWDTRGRLWVVEMADYPTGIDGTPGQGRVRFLEDEDGDGIYDRSTLFLSDLLYPNSVFPWRDGVLVAAADRILWARDTDGDGTVDEREDVITGFSSGNAQHQLGGLEWGLGNWVHVGNGGSKGELRSAKTGETVTLGSRDMRFRPDSGEVELASGATQYGLTRDDWGNWFGCNNSRPWWHYALDDTYTRRNPHVPWPDAKRLLGDEPIAGPVFPASRTLSRFNDYDAANRFTSACGLRVFRDRLPDNGGGTSLFVAEPVHNLVSRRLLSPEGTTFVASRFPNEASSEFFASTDNWSRPTSIRTGPDGAVYIVDMYRLVIEHPEWIPENWQRRLDLQEGNDRGRIYRVIPKGATPDPLPDLSALSTEELVAALDHGNGTRRDLAHLELLWRGDEAAVAPLTRIATEAKHPAARVQALAAIDGLGGITPAVLSTSLEDPHPGVRRHAIRLAEPFLREGDGGILENLSPLAEDEEAHVRQQLAYSLGESEDPRAAEMLASLLAQSGDDSYLLHAALSSAIPHAGGLVEHLAEDPATLSGTAISALVRTLAETGNTAGLAAMLEAAGQSPAELALRVETLEASGKPLHRLAQADDALLSTALASLAPVFASARAVATDSDRPLPERTNAIRLLGGSPDGLDADLDRLLSLLSAEQPAAVQDAAIERCHRLGHSAVAEGILASFSQLGARARDRAIASLVSRQSWASLFLAAAEERPELLRFLDAAQREALRTHRSEPIRTRAVALLDADRIGMAKRLAVFEESLTLDGDIVQGRVHYQTLCASCHRLGDEGFSVGPDLAALTNRSREALLVAILDPNAALEGKYEMVVAETKDGRSVSGLMASESGGSLTLLGAGGVEETILRQDLAHLQPTARSLMPEGLEAALDTQGMADLLAYVQEATGGSRVSPEADGAIRLSADTATATGPRADRDPETGALGWISREDAATWKVGTLPAGDYAIFFHAGLEASDPPSLDTFSLEIGDRIIHGTVEHTGSVRRLRKRQFGEVVIPGDLDETTIRFRHSHPDGQVSIREIALIPRR